MFKKIFLYLKNILSDLEMVQHTNSKTFSHTLSLFLFSSQLFFSVNSLDCYRNNGVNLKIDEISCNFLQQDFCLKALTYAFTILTLLTITIHLYLIYSTLLLNYFILNKLKKYLCAQVYKYYYL